MSLLKTNEIQNYNGSSLTLTASTVSTSAQLNTGGNISVTGSLNVSDDSTTRTNLGLGTIATQDSDSITVTGGTATLGALTVSGSDSGDLVRITQTGSGNALVVEDSANPDSTPFVVTNDGKVGIGVTPTRTLQVSMNSAGATVGQFKNTGGADAMIGFEGNASSGEVDCRLGVSTNDLTFTTNNTERMRIDSTGDVKINTTAEGDSYAGGAVFAKTNYNRAILYTSHTDTVSRQVVIFGANGSQSGSISCSPTATTYNTSSDYRLKENITEITDGITRIKQLNPSRFNFIADPDNTVDGFIAHEVQDIVREAVTGEKDAVDSDGKPEYQGVDYGRITPLLTAALKEAIAKIEMLEERIAVLEAR